ncbi:hypothetical protein QFC19_007515 [Naganishia cerealis]|uniref:Uncharacterized protein n=1 Tax=Naganishia cerealis TaxID=610337 RepID=A0ACC2V983_9TREE|nr:hypothetical protein QFC19_007515 [Naganishia cerealis]
MVIRQFLLVFWLTLALATNIIPVSQPDIDYDSLGGRIGLFGQFDALAVYSYEGQSNFLVEKPSSDSKLYLRDLSKNINSPIATCNGHITEIGRISEDSVLVNGNFTTFNNKTFHPPIIYNISSNDVTSIIPVNQKRDDMEVQGDVKTTFIDGDLIYLGGDFSFNGTYGVAIYNQTSKTLSSTPFQGFGKNSSVNAITKILDKDDNNVNSGSIIFGGKFDTLGLPDLLKRNVSSNSTRKHHKNSTNTSLIAAEQIISLKHGQFSNVNGASNDDDSSLVCPSGGSVWSLQPNMGGQWAVSLPSALNGLFPTKARLYVPQGEDGVKFFRIYTYPNNGIMNLSYIDPSTNTRKYCDSSCPLMQASKLSEATSNNIENAKNLTDSTTFVDSEDGSFSTYYDSSTKTKTLGYGEGYQEFAFENQVPIDKIGITVTDWFGSKGELAGFELYLNSIVVYGNDTLNEPNCDEEDDLSNYSDIEQGKFASIQSLSDSVIDTSYVVSTDPKAEITLYPNISYSGNYSLLFHTPGCIQDNSCSNRLIVNVTVIDHEDTILASHLIYQNNDYNKFDYLFYGHLNGSSTSDGRNKVRVSYSSSIGDSKGSWTVVDKVTANIVSLDDYYDRNSTNKTMKKNTSDYDVTTLELNGLFEYSLNNFSSFEPSAVSYKKDNSTIISKRNTFVGNSSINVLSSKLSKDSEVNNINLHDKTLTLLGDFESKNLSLSNNNLLTLSLSPFNSSSNQSESTLAKRLLKRASQKIYGVEFNNSISKIFNYYNSEVFVGSFGIQNLGSTIKDLSNKNATTDSGNNFAIYGDSTWYTFGNEFIDADFDQFSNFTLDDVEYFVFSSSSSDDSQIWDNSNRKWLSDSDFDVSLALDINSKQQVLSGSSFNVMDLNSVDQAYIGKGDLKKYDFKVTNGSISASYYVNDSVSIVGGFFNSELGSNLGVVSNDGKQSSVTPIALKISLSKNSSIQALYADHEGKYLFVGTNGSASIGLSTSITGVVIYDLQENELTDFQPASLSNSNSGNVAINSIVLHDKDEKLLVGGNFTTAGSLLCEGLCIYDIKNTRWNSPLENDELTGVVTHINFFETNKVLIGGSLKLNGRSQSFVTYDISKSAYSTDVKSLDSDELVQKFILVDESDMPNGRIIAYGPGFVKAYDGKQWHSIDKDILFDSATELTDIKLLPLKKSNTANKQTYFDKNQVLALAGRFNLTDYGPVNLALFNSTSWTPFVFTKQNSTLGSIGSILMKDSLRLQSLEDVKKESKMTRGQVVGVSLAAALGSTALMGLLYLIPYYAFFRQNNRKGAQQRIHENEMMDAVNPQELFHEIDLHRNH